MSGKKKQHIFKLSGVKPDEIDKQYDFKFTNSGAALSEKYIPCESTQISELQHFKQNITLIDELKNTHNTKISSVYEYQNKAFHCFWDRHPFSTPPIFCPVEKIHQPLVKTYVSNINGKSYKIQDSMQDSKYQEYYVDGVFCSTECCLAYIDSNKYDPLYQNSEYYLREIFHLTDQKKAPHWRLLNVYGGNLSIEEFRKSFVNTLYTPDGVIYNPICFLFRENYHLWNSFCSCSSSLK